MHTKRLSRLWCIIYISICASVLHFELGMNYIKPMYRYCLPIAHVVSSSSDEESYSGSSSFSPLAIKVAHSLGVTSSGYCEASYHRHRSSIRTGCVDDPSMFHGVHIHRVCAYSVPPGVGYLIWATHFLLQDQSTWWETARTRGLNFVKWCRLLVEYFTPGLVHISIVLFHAFCKRTPPMGTQFHLTQYEMSPTVGRLT